jgi:hypothetical protein
MINFEYNNRKYIPYTYWRRHVAPWRSKIPHKNYFPTYREYVDYYDLASADGYMPYGMFTQESLPSCWIRLLDDLRRQAGLRPLNGHEEEESLDKGCIICYD